MLGGVFPLATDQMFRAMTYPGASSFLGGVVSRFSVPTAAKTDAWIGSPSHYCPLGLSLLRAKDPSEKQVRQCMYSKCSYCVEEAQISYADVDCLGNGLKASNLANAQHIKPQIVASDRSKASFRTDQNRHVPEPAEFHARPTEPKITP